MLGGLWASYLRSLEHHPLLTKCLTSLTGFCVGDAVAQLPLRGQYDGPRTARFAFYGFFVHAPACQAWFQLLDASVFPSRPTSVEAVLAKVLLDQGLFTPLSLLVFYVVLGVLEGRRAHIRETLREKYRRTLLATYCVWPLAHIVNFAFLPPAQRILYVNVVQVFWNIILCRIAASKGGPESDKLAAKRQRRSRASVDLEQARSWLKDASPEGKSGQEQRPSQGAKWAAVSRQASQGLRQQDGAIGAMRGK